MKKIFLSALFLLFISISSNALAQATGCNGTIATCADSRRSTSATCLSATGCTFTGTPAACGSTTTQTCGNFASSSTCNANPGCFWVATGDANSNAFVNTMCNALKIVTGNGGKAFAAFAIISVGIGFFTGKISWGLMIGVTAGIAAMFGAPTIVAAIAGGNALDCGSGS